MIGFSSSFPGVALSLLLLERSMNFSENAINPSYPSAVGLVWGLTSSLSFFCRKQLLCWSSAQIICSFFAFSGWFWMPTTNEKFLSSFLRIWLLETSSEPLHALEKACWWQANRPWGNWRGSKQMALKANLFSDFKSPPGRTYQPQAITLRYHHYCVKLFSRKGKVTKNYPSQMLKNFWTTSGFLSMFQTWHMKIFFWRFKIVPLLLIPGRDPSEWHPDPCNPRSGPDSKPSAAEIWIFGFWDIHTFLYFKYFGYLDIVGYFDVHIHEYLDIWIRLQPWWCHVLFPRSNPNTICLEFRKRRFLASAGICDVLHCKRAKDKVFDQSYLGRAARISFRKSVFAMFPLELVLVQPNLWWPEVVDERHSWNVKQFPSSCWSLVTLALSRICNAPNHPPDQHCIHFHHLALCTNL